MLDCDWRVYLYCFVLIEYNEPDRNCNHEGEKNKKKKASLSLPSIILGVGIEVFISDILSGYS